MKFVVEVVTNVITCHTYEVEADDKYAAEAKAWQTFQAIGSHEMSRDIDSFRFLRNDRDENVEKEVSVYTMDAAEPCEKCKNKPALDHTVENFDCWCSCHDEPEDEDEEDDEEERRSSDGATNQ